MRWLDQTILQNVKRITNDDRCAEISMGYSEDSRRSKYDNHRNRQRIQTKNK